MKTKSIIALTAALLAPVAMGQTIYKCPSVPGAPPVFQQMPCNGGESLDVKPIQGSGGGLRPEEIAVTRQMSETNRAAEQARAEVRAEGIREDNRREAVAIERRKAAAMEEQAAALRALRYRRY